MNSKKNMSGWIKLFTTISLVVSLIWLTGCNSQTDRNSIPLMVKNNIPGSPQIFGLPIPQGELYSIDQVRLLNESGKEVPSQITKVTTWEPADHSIKWIWVFFFTEKGDTYKLEYGSNVRNGLDYNQEIYVKNNQRTNGEVIVDTGVLRFTIKKGGSGFFDKVELDIDGNGYGQNEVIANGTKERSSFMDILDDAGVDHSKAVIKRSVKELGSGPLHSIIRVEGEYHYSNENNVSPFVTRIHSYAGKSYVKVLHTLTYTGNPDKHQKPDGEYEAIATRDGDIIEEEKLKNDKGWMQPDDRIESAGLSLIYNLSKEKKISTAYYNGRWWESGNLNLLEESTSNDTKISMYQSGPNPDAVPPVLNSTKDERIVNSFVSTLHIGDKEIYSKEKSPGWIDISDHKWGITLGIRNFFEEYPKEINIDQEDSLVTAFIWSPKNEPMGFVRADSEEDSGMIANFAQGLAKTTELMFNFHSSEDSIESISKSTNIFFDPPLTHASPNWYAKSGVFGKISETNNEYSKLERSLEYKFKWMKFNQMWEPWYGIWNFGDFKSYYYSNNWIQWTNNEPAVDYMWWLQFIRTGNRDYYMTAQSASRHSMDVDNIHWPNDPEYFGDTNESLHAFQYLNKSKGSPYLGMGRRHARQHWTSLLSAHVWISGWLSSYYLDGYHRGLEVAEMTGDYYIKRVFDLHGLRGRRLYLSVWNLTELWDATKKEKYRKELKDRVDLMLSLQKNADQAGSLVIDRYGYSQVYVANGLSKYLQMTGDESVKYALITHARWLRDVPPNNHDMESYLSSISILVLGYELSGNKSFLEEAIKRSKYLQMEKIPENFETYSNQLALHDSLEQASELPEGEDDFFPSIWKVTNGMRVFGWTHIYNIPNLIYSIDNANIPNEFNEN